MALLLRFLLVAVLFSSFCICTQAPVVSTPSGPFVGRHLAEFDQDLFFGIRFADAPRLRNPKPVTDTWSEPRDARYPGLACCLDCYQESLDYQNVSVGEDCLNLNIIRPSGTTEDSKLPVAVWLYGGGFAAGLSHDTTSNTSYTIQASVESGTPIITVSLNYRLGFLGFPGGYQAQAAGITNLGLKDQRVALEWIQKNIGSFGGDPRKVTLWGQSAGAASIGNQILAYGGKGADELFRGAIMVSGAPYGETNMLMPTHPNCVRAYEDIINLTDCDKADSGLDCLRNTPLDTLWDASRLQEFPTWWPMIDGDFIEEPPVWQMEAGRFSRDIIVLAGANSDEGLSMSAWFAAGTETEYELRMILENLFPAAREELIDQILDMYEVDDPSPPYSLPVVGSGFCEALEAANMSCGSQFRRFAAIGGDHAQISARRQMVRQWAERGGVAYSYR